MKQAPASMRRPPSPPSWPRRGQPQRFPSGGRPMDDKNLTFETSAGVEVIGNFYAMGIREDLLRGIYGYGFEKPSAIEQRAVIPIISGRDIIALAQSGIGKTFMISLSVSQVIDTNIHK
ncbi:hypothetical protein ZWY2020_043146 [Hordeum vulgare]|nr:hypothetical protein ZWY2020_043146 [Hordeum vulgare]